MTIHLDSLFRFTLSLDLERILVSVRTQYNCRYVPLSYDSPSVNGLSVNALMNLSQNFLGRRLVTAARRFNEFVEIEGILFPVSVQTFATFFYKIRRETLLVACAGLSSSDSFFRFRWKFVRICFTLRGTWKFVLRGTWKFVVCTWSWVWCNVSVTFLRQEIHTITFTWRHLCSITAVVYSAAVRASFLPSWVVFIESPNQFWNPQTSRKLRDVIIYYIHVLIWLDENCMFQQHKKDAWIPGVFYVRNSVLDQVQRSMRWWRSYASWNLLKLIM